jgi:hypothetical protein
MPANPSFNSLSHPPIAPPGITEMIKELTKLFIIHRLTTCGKWNAHDG